MRNQWTAALRGQLERAAAGDAEARRLLLELARDRLTAHARRPCTALTLANECDSWGRSRSGIRVTH